MKADQSLFAKNYPPIYQAGLVLAIAVLVMLIAKLVSLAGGEVSYRFYWMTSCAFLLFFAMFNSIISLSAGNLDKYWTKAFLAFAALVVGTGFFASVISGVWIQDAGRIKYVYVILVFSYLVFLCILGMVKFLMAFFMQEEENLRASGTKQYKKKEE